MARNVSKALNLNIPEEKASQALGKVAMNVYSYFWHDFVHALHKLCSLRCASKWKYFCIGVNSNFPLLLHMRGAKYIDAASVSTAQ